MKFKDAYVKMLEGYKIKRPCFKGYWFIDGYTGKLNIHCRNGETITTGDLDLTVKNTLAEDWEIGDPDDCVMSGNRIKLAEGIQIMPKVETIELSKSESQPLGFEPIVFSTNPPLHTKKKVTDLNKDEM